MSTLSDGAASGLSEGAVGGGGGPAALRILRDLVLAQAGGPMMPCLDSLLGTNPATQPNVRSLDPSDPYLGLFPQQGAWEATTDPANPYAWAAGSGSGLTSVAAVVGGDLRVYGTQGATDITTYSANNHGLIDVTMVEQHPMRISRASRHRAERR